MHFHGDRSIFVRLPAPTTHQTYLCCGGTGHVATAEFALGFSCHLPEALVCRLASQQRVVGFFTGLSRAVCRSLRNCLRASQQRVVGFFAGVLEAVRACTAGSTRSYTKRSQTARSHKTRSHTASPVDGSRWFSLCSRYPLFARDSAVCVRW